VTTNPEGGNPWEPSGTERAGRRRAATRRRPWSQRTREQTAGWTSFIEASRTEAGHVDR